MDLDLLAVQGTLKSPPTPQFKSINSSALSLLHSPTLTSIHDHRKRQNSSCAILNSERWTPHPQVGRCPIYATGDQWRNNSRKNEGMEPKQKQHPVVDGTGCHNLSFLNVELYPLESLSEDRAEWIVPNLLHEASITLIPKLDKDITRKLQI